MKWGPDLERLGIQIRDFRFDEIVHHGVIERCLIGVETLACGWYTG